MKMDANQQRVFPLTYQPENLGHRRRPSIGKSMPVTALLLNFPSSSTYTRNYDKLSQDGLSPDSEKPPILFKLNEVNDTRLSSRSSTTSSSSSSLSELAVDENFVITENYSNNNKSNHNDNNNNNKNNNNNNNNNNKEDMEQDYEILISDLSDDDNNGYNINNNCNDDGDDGDDNSDYGDNHENDNNGINNDKENEEENFSLVSNMECTSCTSCSPVNLEENSENLMNRSQVNYYNNNNSNSDTGVERETNLKNILEELCRKLCVINCKMEIKEQNECENNLNRENENNNENLINLYEDDNNCNKNYEKISSKIDKQRRNFLNEMLKTSSDSDLLSASINCDNTDEDIKKKRGNDNLLKPDSFRKGFTMSDLSGKYALTEALAKTSMMTSPAAKRRLAARKIELKLDSNNSTGNDDLSSSGEKEFVPPRDLLLYLVRMGSFNSAPKINNPDSQDDSFEIPQGLSPMDLLQHFKFNRGDNYPKLLSRRFLKPIPNNSIISTNDVTKGLRVLELNTVSKVCSPPLSSKHIRVFQWNMLSQSLGQHNDNFVCCPDEALIWENRKYLIIEEIIRNNPDIICLQEVDHFKFLERILETQNYSGIFFPKPDSPCLYIEENNGPDGCAIFYKREKFNVINYQTRILEVWRVQSNQVAIAINFKIKETKQELCVCTTHLKARNGALLSKLRNEQGKDLLKFITNISNNRPLILCGDFNAEPNEPVYSTILNFKEFNLSSAYADIYAKIKNKYQLENFLTSENNCCSKNNNANINNNTSENQTSDIDENKEKCLNVLTKAEILANNEPPYTTWKIREEGEICHTIDYIFYSKDYFEVNNCLMFPNEEEVGKSRTPSLQYPSDHFSLVCDFEIIDPTNK